MLESLVGADLLRGRYPLRVRADTFNPVDGTPGDQCCWTNGHVELTITG